MEMFFPIFLIAAVLAAAMDSVAEDECADDSDERECAETHDGMVWARSGGCEDESWLMPSTAHKALVLGTEIEEDLFGTSWVNGGSRWRDAENDHRHAINPANGLPMASGSQSGVDVMGNPYGTDFHHDNSDYFGGSSYEGMDSFGSTSGHLGSLGGSDDWS